MPQDRALAGPEIARDNRDLLVLDRLLQLRTHQRQAVVPPDIGGVVEIEERIRGEPEVPEVLRLQGFFEMIHRHAMVSHG
jgi:hypothetical protein